MGEVQTPPSLTSSVETLTADCPVFLARSSASCFFLRSSSALLSAMIIDGQDGYERTAGSNRYALLINLTQESSPQTDNIYRTILSIESHT